MHRLVYWLAIFLLVGCAASTGKRITDDTLNKIAECTGGVAGSAGFMGKIEASVKEKKMEVGGSADVNYKEIIRGVIFSEENISDDLKKFYFTEYQKCLDKVRNAVDPTIAKALESGFKVTVEGGRIIAEKDNGKIIALDRGSCIGDSDHFIDPKTGKASKIHKISVELINLFDRPVSILEHHVNSRIDHKEIRGYSYKVDSLFALKPGEKVVLNITAQLWTDRIQEHIEKFDKEGYGVTEEVVFVTSEGSLPAIPVRSISEPCI